MCRCNGKSRIWRIFTQEYSVHKFYFVSSCLKCIRHVWQLNILECHDREELQYFVRRNLFLVIPFYIYNTSVSLFYCGTLTSFILKFQQDPGPALLLLIYSAVLARGIDRQVPPQKFNAIARL